MAINLNTTPPPDVIREMIFYRDGELYWFPEYYKGRRTYRPIGNFDTDGYKRTTITIDGVTRSYKIHRLIYWLHTGEWPEVVDHFDRNKANNYISNLRPSTVTENNRNKGVQKNNSSGYTGIFFTKGSYNISIGFDGMMFRKAGFKTLESAIIARNVVISLFYPERDLIEIPK
ncbi:HNH endonuclease [Escherichia coli]|nr:HNH endonuclease [Escherichia coli]